MPVVRVFCAVGIDRSAMPQSSAVKRAAAKAKAAAAAEAGAVVEPAFRLQRKQVGLTYSCPVADQAHPIENVEVIRDELLARYGHAMYTISREEHESGQPHFHAHFTFDAKLDSTDPRCMDIAGVHPNIVKGGPAWENYIRKDNDFITNKAVNSYAVALEAATPEEGLEILWKQKPQDMLKFGETIERNLRKRFAPASPYQPYLGPYGQWIDWNFKKFSLLIWGPSGGGKTQFARWLMAHLFGDYIFVKKNHEELKKVTQWKPFLFDEVYLIEKEAALSREITDVENGGSISCRNFDGTIPSDIPRVFTSNYEFPFKNPREAVYGRRVISFEYDQGVIVPEMPERQRSRSPRQREALARYDPTGVLSDLFK